ncbi:MAG: threonine synthase [Proteobacteria bacterium]|nr:threonine synthase [Pseudomonadota bacterium]
MKFYNCKNKSETISAKEVFIKGIADDGGLYMPEHIPTLSKDELSSYHSLKINELAFEISKRILAEDIEINSLEKICNEAFNFPVPLRPLSENLSVLELFHGPTYAFKDFGARYLARLLGYFRKNENKLLNVLVATSGDTGSAVADGFYKVPGVKVTILYPSGKVSPLQEKQLTTLGENITTLEVDGVFDDCQSLVKQAFSDSELRKQVEITSANSINFGRLFPQSFYYFLAALQQSQDISVVVPSGNLGNVTAGLIAKRMGLNIKNFIVATNLNDSFPQYLATENFLAKKTIHTISNAMDVGNPNNFPRILDLYDNNFTKIKSEIQGISIGDLETKNTMLSVFKDLHYQVCPHTAVGIAAHNLLNKEGKSIVLATAHPAKFLEVVEEVIHEKVKLPAGLEEAAKKEKRSIKIGKEFQEFKKLLLSN